MKNKGLLEILIIYLFVTIFVSLKNIAYYKNIINPVFWGIILIFLIWKVKNGAVRFRLKKRFFIYLIIILIFNTSLYFYLGVYFGFSKNPYSHEISSIIKNVFVTMVPVIAIEMTRIVIGLKNKENKLVLALLTILLILLEINYNTINNNLSSREESFKYICSQVLPLIFYNFLYMYLVLKDLYFFTLLNRVLEALIVLLSPIVPNINWFVIGSFNILSSVAIYLVFKFKIANLKNRQKVNYIVTISFSIIIVCFMLGAFKYQPISIMSNSMLPLYRRGDVIIFEKPKKDELDDIPKESIIIYSLGDKNIAHRVINVVKSNGNTFYQTKGDNNDFPDENLVDVSQIIGVYVFHIKYIGFPSIWLNEYLKGK